MSKGPGRLQQDILDELRCARGLLTWDELKTKFPRQAQDHSLHRAVRSLREIGRVRECEVRGRRWLAACGTPGLGNNTDRKLLDLREAAHAQLRAVAKVKGVPVPSLTELPSLERKRRPLRHDLDA